MIDILNQSINASLLSNEIMRLEQIANQSTLSFLIEYSRDIPTLALRGDMLAIILLFIAFFIMIVVINKVTSMLISVIHRTFIFMITGIAVFYFSQYIITEMSAANGVSAALTPQMILLAAAGFSIGTVGLIMAGVALFRMIQRARGYYEEELPPLEKAEKELAVEKAKIERVKEIKEAMVKEEKYEAAGFRDMLSVDSIKSDRSLLSIITFIIVAQFGVFSTPTAAAPNVKIGLSMFAVFILGCFVFIRQSYSRYWRGVFHLLVALLFGIVLSFVLGTSWAETPIQTLLSLDYFKTNSLVAVISGVALSLFAAGKN